MMGKHFVFSYLFNIMLIFAFLFLPLQLLSCFLSPQLPTQILICEISREVLDGRNEGALDVPPKTCHSDFWAKNT
jgi:hypothetical protein